MELSKLKLVPPQESCFLRKPWQLVLSCGKPCGQRHFVHKLKCMAFLENSGFGLETWTTIFRFDQDMRDSEGPLEMYLFGSHHKWFVGTLFPMPWCDFRNKNWNIILEMMSFTDSISSLGHIYDNAWRQWGGILIVLSESSFCFRFRLIIHRSQS